MSAAERAAVQSLIERGERVTAHHDEFEAAAVPWSEPVNLLADLAAPPLSADTVPSALGEFARAYATATGFDVSMCLGAAVTVAAASLSDAFQIVADPATRRFQQARLWTLTIGRPGAGKTPAQREMLAPLWALHQRIFKAWLEDKARADAADEAPPPRTRIVIADATIEALSEALRETPRGALIAAEEFESWLGSLDVYRRGGVSRDRGEWLRLFDGGPHTVERVQRGAVYVPNWGVSILTATTPAALAKLTKSLPEDGLLQRFIPIVAGSQTDGTPVPELDALRARYTETITRLYVAKPDAHAGCAPLSFEAQQAFRTWEREIRITQEALGALEPALESHVAKYPTLLLRLALTFHAVEVVNQRHEHARDIAAVPVALQTVTLAAAFLRAVLKHAMVLYLRRDGSEVYELAQECARAILAHTAPWIARRDLVQRVRKFRGASEEYQAGALRLLVDLGWLRYAAGGYQKGTPARYDVNPSLASRFATIAERERERRAVARELIAETVAERRGKDS